MQGGDIVIPRGWVFGYKLHLTSTTGEIVVPLTADVTTANVQDNQMYVPLTSSIFCILFIICIVYGS